MKRREEKRREDKEDRGRRRREGNRDGAVFSRFCIFYNKVETERKNNAKFLWTTAPRGSSQSRNESRMRGCSVCDLFFAPGGGEMKQKIIIMKKG